MEFREKVRQILGLSGLKKKFIDKITDPKGMRLYTQAFTHESVNPKENYEWLEILGDSTLNKCVVWYINNRFPQLHNKEGVKVIARLKINLVSKKIFSEIARELGFMPYIRFDPSNNNGKPILEADILEDTFEAFFGATEMLIDEAVSVGSGYGICYNLLKSIMDPVPISLRYEDLFDAVTRLKETFDANKSLGLVGYTNVKTPTGQQHVVVYSHFNTNTKKGIKLAEAIAQTKAEGQQQAATIALQLLASKGIKKAIDPYYLNLA